MTVSKIVKENYDDTGAYVGFDEILDVTFDTFAFGDDSLRELSDKVVTYWEEDYDFEALLEEFNLETKDAFYALLQTGMIDPESLEAFLVD